MYRKFSELRKNIKKFVKRMGNDIYTAVPDEWWDPKSRESETLSLLEAVLMSFVEGETEDGTPWNFKRQIMKALDQGRVIPWKERDEALLEMLFEENEQQQILQMLQKDA